MVPMVLTNATLIDGSVATVTVLNGLVDSVGDPASIAPGSDVTDLSGYVLLPSAVEPHAHLDKAFLAEAVANPTGDLLGAIGAMEANRDLVDVDGIIVRAERAARLMSRNGYRAIRTHADATAEHGLRSVEALLEVKKRVADVIDIEIVVLTGWPVTGRTGGVHRSLLRDALDMGADLVGGCPHLEDDADAATDVLLGIASEYERGVDLHTDETLDPDAHGLDTLARHVLDGFEFGATASHCVSLDQQPIATQESTAERVAAAGVNVVVLPHTNLFLQGRGRTPMPRSLTSVQLLQSAGVNVAAGADNLQDPFNPVGRACPFETAGLMIMAAHELPAPAWRMVSNNAARTLGLTGGDIKPGNQADLLGVRAASVREAIAFGPPERIIWRRGRRLGRAS